jgi:hypothetical protein
MDNGAENQTAHHNPRIREIYGKLLGQPGDERSRELFYTRFEKREVLL